MAILNRSYRSVGLTPFEITRYVAVAGVSVLLDSGAWVTLQYDNALVEVNDLDQAMSERGYVFDAAAALTGAKAPQVLLFFGTGYFRVSTGIDIQEPALAFTASAVVLRREIAGTAGTTEIDILVNGVSMFLPANRPKILFGAGNGARVSVVPDVPAIPANARVEMVILSAEAGDPQDVVAEILP